MFDKKLHLIFKLKESWLLRAKHLPHFLFKIGCITKQIFPSLKVRDS